MAWADAYATAAEYRNRIQKSITSDDAAIEIGLTAISRMIERELGSASAPRVFNQGDIGEFRWFSYRRTSYETPQFIEIDDVVTVTAVHIDTDANGSWETAAAATDYVLWPYNAPVHDFPYTRLELHPSPSVSFAVDYPKPIRVTGTWGWPAVPAPIKEATIQLAAILRIESPRAEAMVSELGQLVQMSAQARGIVDRLKATYSRKKYAV